MPQGTVATLRVPELLKRKGWSMSELSRRSGLSYPTVWRLVKGEPGPVSLDTALAIARAFELPLEEVIAEVVAGR